jgi:hypothetical protein
MVEGAVGFGIRQIVKDATKPCWTRSVSAGKKESSSDDRNLSGQVHILSWNGIAGML